MSLRWRRLSTSLSATLNHPLYIRPVFNILVKSTYVTCHFGVLMRCERENWDEAQGKPRPTGDAAGGQIAAVAAGGDDVLGAFEVGGELLGAKGYAEGHFEGWAVRMRSARCAVGIGRGECDGAAWLRVAVCSGAQQRWDLGWCGEKRCTLLCLWQRTLKSVGDAY